MRERRIGPAATVIRKFSENVSSDAAMLGAQTSVVRESAKTAADVRPTQSEIATVAYQLWLDRGYPVGSDQEDWFRAEAMLKNAQVAECEELAVHPSIPCRDIRTESETRTEFRWKGHWEVWEMEWNEPRWVED
jgi:hypothetical protein